MTWKASKFRGLSKFSLDSLIPKFSSIDCRLASFYKFSGFSSYCKVVDLNCLDCLGLNSIDTSSSIHLIGSLDFLLCLQSGASFDFVRSVDSIHSRASRHSRFSLLGRFYPFLDCTNPLES